MSTCLYDRVPARPVELAGGAVRGILADEAAIIVVESERTNEKYSSKFLDALRRRAWIHSQQLSVTVIVICHPPWLARENVFPVADSVLA